MFEIVAVAFGGGCVGSRPAELGLDTDNLGPRCCNRAGAEAAEGIEQVAMALGIKQPAIVVLAVDFGHQAAKLAHQPGGHRRRADEAAATPIALERSADYQRFAGID